MLLRDEEFDSLESLCYCFERDIDELKDYLRAHGYVYSEAQLQFRPEGYDRNIDAPQPTPTFDRNAVESAFCFFHQKQRVYEFSNMEWQRDDIEYAIEDYVSTMSTPLYAHLARGRQDFLRNHVRFEADILEAIDSLESLMA